MTCENQSTLNITTKLGMAEKLVFYTCSPFVDVIVTQVI
jgi:hypothetical protein